MKIAICIPCHNQQKFVKIAISRLMEQSVKPDYIIIINDHSDIFSIKSNSIVKTFNSKVKGRTHSRNLAIKKAKELNTDLLLFMDGDSIPEDKNYIHNYLNFYTDNKSRIVFGTRKHINTPINIKDFNDKLKYKHRKIKKYPSDLLTANMDNLYGKMDFKTDLRTVAGVTDMFNDIASFDEKCDLILTGMVTWSCNFAINIKAVDELYKLMTTKYDVDGWFDYTAFENKWGYEDIAFGLDAHFCGIDIKMNSQSDVLHFLHDRKDDLFTHVKGRHVIMNRYRNLIKNK